MRVMSMVSEIPSMAAVNSSSTFNMKRTHEWLFSDVPSDIFIEVGESIFALHKFPLVSNSGRIRKHLAESKDATKVHLQDMPGGAEAFEFAAKFCYGLIPEITACNVAMLRCAASYLDMTDHHSDGSLESRTETFLNEIVCHVLPDSVTVLHTCENLLPFAEDLKIISRCIEAITSAASNEELKRGLSRLTATGSQSHWISSQDYPPPQQQLQPQSVTAESDSWWGKELIILNIHMLQRVITAMKSKGVGQEIISGALMHYARNSLELYTNTSNKIQPIHASVAQKVGVGSKIMRAKFKSRGAAPPTLAEREKLSVVETVISLLPPQSKTMPVSFISWLLRVAMMLNATASYRTELEKRLGCRLEQATLDDLLIPSYSDEGGYTLYDTNVVLRIVKNFLQFSEDGGESDSCSYESDEGSESDKQNENVIKVSKLMDSYLTEIARDSNLTVSKFVALAEAVPDDARLVDDGLYRAIDIFLKVHPTIKDFERNKLCKLLDCRKLSDNACNHATQNEHLPIQIAIRVLYFEQLKLRNTMNRDNHHHNTHPHHNYNHSHHIESPSTTISPQDNYASIRRENKELKLEVAQMRTRLTDLEKGHVSMKQELVKVTPTHKFLNSFSKNLRKLNSIFQSKDNSFSPLLHNINNNNTLMSRKRRHSIS